MSSWCVSAIWDLAPWYLPSASPRADIERRWSHIADAHREDVVHIIYSIAYCNIKLHNCPPLLLGPFRLPLGSVLALKEDQPFQSPIPPLLEIWAIAEWSPKLMKATWHTTVKAAIFFMCTLPWQWISLSSSWIFTYYPMNFVKAQRLGVYGLYTTWQCLWCHSNYSI